MQPSVISNFADGFFIHKHTQNTLKSLLVIYSLLIGLFVTVFSACSEAGENKGGQQKRTLDVCYLVTSSTPFSKSLVLNGSLIPNEEITMRSEVNGRVVSILFEEGDRVQKGQTLVRLDDRDLRAELEKTEIMHRQAKVDVKRRESLLKDKAISEEEYDTYSNREKELSAGIKQLEARIDQYRIKAPFDGLVGLRSVSQGTMVSVGETIASLVMTSPLKVEFSVPEEYAQLVKPGDTIFFTLRNNSDTLSAHVFATDGRISPSTRSLKVRALYDNRDDKLIPGAYANVIYPLTVYADAIMIPTDAVVSSSDGQRVMHIKNGKAYPTLVKTGERTENEVHVLDGLRSGDTIALTGLLYLREGMAVELQETPAR